MDNGTTLSGCDVLQLVYDKLCAARDDTASHQVEMVLDQVIEMVVDVSKQEYVPIDLRNRLIASIR